MKKKLILPVMLVIASVLSLSGCGEEKKEKVDEAVNPTKAITEIADDVLNCGIEFPEMIEVSEENFQIKYGLSEGDYEEYALWWAGSGADADEVCIIKATDKEKVKEAVEDRLKGQKEVFRDYVPEQYDKLCETKVKTKGDYIYWLCTNDNKKAQQALNADFN